MLRKLLTCILLLLVLLTACRPDPVDSAIYCATRWPDRGTDQFWEWQVFSIDAAGNKQMLSRWDDTAILWLAPYLFHIEETDNGWCVTSTAADGTEETLWLDSTQLPEEYQGYTVWDYGIRLVDGVLYLPCRGSSAFDWFVAAVTPDGSARCFPLEHAALPPLMQIWNNRLYYLGHNAQPVMELDLSTGVSRSVAASPQGTIDRSWYHLDNGIFWYLVTDHDARTDTLLGVDVVTGIEKARVTASTLFAQNEWIMNTNCLFINEGYLYYFQWAPDLRCYLLWEIPLSALLGDGVSWQALFREGGAAKLLVEDVPYDRNFPPAQLLFGKKGLWLCYATSHYDNEVSYFGANAWRADYAPGEVRYIPYAH